jgi:hypothetical protein
MYALLLLLTSYKLWWRWNTHKEDPEQGQVENSSNSRPPDMEKSAREILHDNVPLTKVAVLLMRVES